MGERLGWRALGALLVLSGTSLAGQGAAPKAQTAGEFYVAFAAAVNKAKSIDELRPYMQKDAAAMMGQMPKEMHAEMLKEVKKNAVTGVKVLKESPFESGFLVEMEGTKKADGKPTKGWAKVAREDGAFKLETEDWSGTPPPQPPQPPKIPAKVAEAGTASGEWTVNGQKAALKFAYAEATPDSFDPKKTGYKLVLSDVAWNPQDYGRDAKVKAGTLHYVELSLGEDKSVYGSMLYHAGFKDSNYLSSAGGGLKFEAETYGPDVLAGRVYMKAPDSGIGGTRYYAATFKAKVQKSR